MNLLRTRRFIQTRLPYLVSLSSQEGRPSEDDILKLIHAALLAIIILIIIITKTEKTKTKPTLDVVRRSST